MMSVAIQRVFHCRALLPRQCCVSVLHTAATHSPDDDTILLEPHNAMEWYLLSMLFIAGNKVAKAQLSQATGETQAPGLCATPALSLFTRLKKAHLL